MNDPSNIYAAKYLKPLRLSILLSVIGEASIFLIWGTYLYPEGNIWYKFLWTLVFCGVGMGSVIRVVIDLFIVDKLDGLKAIIASAATAFLILGVFCNLLCFKLDLHFNLFGAQEASNLFIINGMLMSLLGGLLLGFMCFGIRERNG